MSGTLPSGWKRVPLGQCCDIISGATPSRNVPEYWGGDIPWVTPKDISRLDHPVLEDAPEKITAAGYAACSTTMMPSGSILFSSRAPIGLVAIAGRSMCTNQGFKSLVPGSDVDSGFLYWTMKRNAPRIAALGNGATFKEVSKEVVGRFEIDLPPLAEQRRIAAILDKADAIRRKRQQTLALADDFLRSAFLEMFGDPVTNPKGWATANLETLGEVKGGLQVTSARLSNSIRLPYLRVANVYRDRLDLDEVKEIGVTDREAQNALLEAGDVLIVEGHGNPEELGRSAVWGGELSSCTHQNHLIRLRPDQRQISPVYASAFINSKGGRRQLLAMGKTTSGLNTISTRNVRELAILLPPLDQQMRYVSAVQQIQKTLLVLQGSLSEAETLFASLSQRAFRGDLLPDPMPA